MHAIAHHLPDFAPKKPRSAEQALINRTPAAQAAVDIPALQREAHEAGRREGEAAARAEAEALRAEDQARFAERLEAERAAWCATESAPLAAALTDAAAELEAVLAERLARIVLPFLETSVQERALSELEALAAPLLAREDRPVVKISGAADLLERLREKLGDPPACLFQAADTVDVRVTAGETVFETQIRAWVDRLGRSIS